MPLGVCPRQELNLRTRLRRAVLYPLSYEGISPAMTLDESDSFNALAKGISERIAALGQADWHSNSPVIGL